MALGSQQSSLVRIIMYDCARREMATCTYLNEGGIANESQMELVNSSKVRLRIYSMKRNVRKSQIAVVIVVGTLILMVNVGYSLCRVAGPDQVQGVNEHLLPQSTQQIC